jgi:hypothetical protein
MSFLIAKLFEAQCALKSSAPGSTNWSAIMDSLRKSTPAPILAHFLRLVSHRGCGVALVRHGVCSECHIRVPFGLVAVLVKPTDVHLCDHCGCYLLLPDEEIPASDAPALAMPQRRGRKCHRALAV